MDSLGQAIIEILVKFTGGDVALGQLESFFNKIDKMTSGTADGLSSLKEGIKDLNDANKDSTLASDLKEAKDASKGLATAYCNINKGLKDYGSTLKSTRKAQNSFNKDIGRGVSRTGAASKATKILSKELKDLKKDFDEGRISATKFFTERKRLFNKARAATLREKEKRQKGANLNRDTRLPIIGETGFGKVDKSDLREANRLLKERNRLQQKGVELANRQKVVQNQFTDDFKALLAAEKAGLISKEQLNKRLFELEFRRRQKLRQLNDAPGISSRRSRNNAVREGVGLALPERGPIKNARREFQSLKTALDRGVISNKQYANAVSEVTSKLRVNILTAKLQSSGLLQQSRLLRDFGTQISAVGRQAVFFGTALIGAFIGPVVTFARFEQSTKDVVAVLGDLNSEVQQLAGFNLLSATFLDLGERTEFTATQIGEAARQLGLAGFSLNEISNSISNVVDLASAGNVELQKAANIAATIGRAFDIDTSNFERIADVLASVATSSNTTVESIGESFKLLAPIAANLGQPLEEVAAAIGSLGNAGIRGGRAGTGTCYDSETEVLTDKGWYKWPEIKQLLDKHPNIKFATLNEESHELEWQNQTEYFEFDHEGPMYKAKNASVDMLVTPEHNLYVATRKKGGYNPYKLIRAKDLNTSSYSVKTTAGNQNPDIDKFIIPSVTIGGSTGNKELPEKEVEMDDWLSFLGAYLSEGYIVKKAEEYQSYVVGVAQRKTSKGWCDFNKVLPNLPIPFKYDEKCGKFLAYSKQLRTALLDCGKGAIHKKIPDYVFKCSTRQIRLFLEFFRLGDGTQINEQGSFKLFTSSDELKDGLSTLAMMAGYRCIVQTLTPEEAGSSVTKDGRIITLSKNRHILSLSSYRLEPKVTKSEIKRHNNRKKLTGLSRFEVFEGFVDYTGKVYCVTVPNNTLFVRRNGRQVWSGNSRFFSELLEKSEDFDARLKQIGSSFEAIDPTKNSISEIVEEFERLQQVAGFNTNDFFSLFDQRSARVIVSLVNQGSDSLRKLNEEAKNSAGAAAEIRKQRLDTLEGQFRITLSALQTTLIELGKTVGPFVTKTLENIAVGLNAATDAVKFFGPQVSSLLVALASLGVSIVAVGGALTVFGTALQAIAANQVVKFLIGLRVQLLSIVGANSAATASTLGLSTALTTEAAAATAAGTATTFFGNAVKIALGPAGLLLLALSALTAAYVVYEKRTKNVEKRFSNFIKGLMNTTKATTELSKAAREVSNSVDLLKNLPNLNELELKILLNGDQPLTVKNLEKLVQGADLQISKLRRKLQRLTNPFPGLDGGRGGSGIENDQGGIAGGIAALTGQSGGTIDILVELDETNEFKIFREKFFDDFSGTGTFKVEVELDSLQKETQELVLQLEEVLLARKELIDNLELTETLNVAFASREGNEAAIAKFEKERSDAEAKIASIEARLQSVLLSAADRTSLEKQFSAQKQIISSLEKQLPILESQRKLTDDQFSRNKQLLDIINEVGKLKESQGKNDEERQMLLAEEFKKASQIFKLRQQQAEAEERQNKILEEQVKLRDKIANKVTSLQEEIDNLGKSEREIALADIQKDREDLAKLLDLSDVDAEGNPVTSLLKQEQENLEKNREKLKELQKELESTEFSPAERVSNKELEASLEKSIKSGLANIEKLKNDVNSFNQVFDEKENLINQEFDQKDAEKRAEELQENKERLLTIKELRLESAKRIDDLSEILRLTAEISREENKELANQEFGTEEEIQGDKERIRQKNEFEQLKEAELQANLADIQKEAQEKRNKELEKAQKQRADRIKERKSLQESISKQLVSQVKTIRDAIALTQFLNAQEGRRNLAIKRNADLQAKLILQEQQARANGDFELAQRRAARLQAAQEIGGFNVNPVANGQIQPNAPANPNRRLNIPQPIVNNKNVVINEGAVQINVDGEVTAEDIATAVQEAFSDLVSKVFV